jgi:hypothetical protein
VNSGKRKAFSHGPHTKLGALAEEYLKKLASVHKGTITSGLVRVDLMTYKGEIVVNEFESLEAFYSTASSRPRDMAEGEYATFQFMKDYWVNILGERVINLELLKRQIPNEW